MSSKRKKRDKEYHERQIKRDQKIIESRRYNGAMAIGDIEQMAKVMRCR